VKALFLAVGLAAVLLMPLTAEQQSPEEGQAGSPPKAGSLQIEEIALRAQAENPQVLKALRTLKNSEEALVGESRLLDSRLSLEAAYESAQNQDGSAAAAGGDAAISGQVGITVPLLEQLSVGGSITAREDRDLQGELSLSVAPFAAGDPTYSEEEAYGKALAAWKTLRQQTYFDAEGAVLDVLIGQMERDLADMSLELERRRYETVQKELELGEASFEELQDQLSELTDARKNLYTVESQSLSSWKELQLLFDPNGGEVDPAPLSLEELTELIRKREERVAALASERPSSLTLATLQLELEALRSELKATPLWRPDLNLSASVDLQDPSKFNLAASLSYSPNDLRKDEREDLQEKIDEKLVDIRSERYALSLQKQLAEQGIAIARQAWEAATLAGQQAASTLQESELLYRQGQLTVFEIEQARLSLESAQIDTYRAAADLYGTQSELLMLYGLVSGD
jgi:outer membrane protein TolC